MSVKVNVELVWKTPIETSRGTKILATVKENVEIEESMTALTVWTDQDKYSRIPLSSLHYYDVEEAI